MGVNVPLFDWKALGSSSLKMFTKLSLALSLFAVVLSEQAGPKGYQHDVTGDTGLPYVHDTTGDFGPYKLWKLRQEGKLNAQEKKLKAQEKKLKAQVPAQKTEQTIAPAYQQEQRQQNYQQPQTYQSQPQAYQQPQTYQQPKVYQQSQTYQQPQKPQFSYQQPG